eukprot:CAMPEP_0197653640 /NCGR_PEP_ID=MMETSP1338-20131121/36528_1 /TAXON_ID=43686 ORGANISM="Pelagodinium beii, Strain RCC1491" /NCGR_SAMPLE_ID=MMETSP1338 /ASSEMBLY_ACC=CAM_ASM_000754 /LENGTH=635 /DNA_ID=CAMNT_0043228833 /DNA_START=108 /DNA_END=2015 /DNA_ORIENTATION=+
MRPFLFLAVASGYSFIDSIEFTESEASDSLMEKSGSKGEKWMELHKALSSTYEALPKNKNGYLDHQAVRYVLHRLFVQRYGWYIKGLEPNGEDWHHKPAPGEGSKIQDWVPSFLQNLLEDKAHHDGLDLSELVSLAAALEDLVSHEAESRLKTAYQIHDVDISQSMDRETAEDIVRTWYVGFLLAGNFSASSPDEVHQKKNVFARKYSDWSHADEWLANVEKEEYAKRDSTSSSFESNLKTVSRIGQEYFRFNDQECSALKSTLKGMEGKKAGRVRLSTFYQKSLYSHWRFTEKADYLRKLGALDESDPKGQQVIVTNYMMARPNCLEASGLYAVCCRNECEDLMGHLEGEIKASRAEPKRVAELVSKLSSDTVAAPRELSPALLERLEQVAASNGGEVPLHGRLFAQWMHHAYPRECPYPHESGTVSPQTPDEWMKETGASDSSASKEEMRQQVESDVCAIDENGKPKGAGCEEAEDLPWSQAEELLSQPSQVEDLPQASEAEEELPSPCSLDHPCDGSTQPMARTGFRWDALAAILSVCLAAALICDYWYTSVCSRHTKADVFYVNTVSNKDLACKFSLCRNALAAWALASLAWVMDLLDTGIFACSMVGGLCVLGAKRAGDKFGQKKEMRKL